MKATRIFGSKTLVLFLGTIAGAALAQTANSLEVDTVVSGISSSMSSAEQAFRMGQAWEALPEPKRQFNFCVIGPGSDSKIFYIGPHAPNLSPDDVQLVHRLWLNMRRDPGSTDLHHSDIITYALTRLAGVYAREKDDVLRDLKNYRTSRAPASMRLGVQEYSEVPAPGCENPTRAIRQTRDQ